MHCLKTLSFAIGLLTANMAAAQTVQFEFTAQLESGFGANFGESLSGVITVDYGTPPDSVSALNPCGQQATWSSGLFSVDVITSGGITAGTTFDGGLISARTLDQPCRPSASYRIENFSGNGLQGKIVQFNHADSRAAGDGIADWSEFDPADDPNTANESSIVFISLSDFEAGIFGSGFYRVDSIRPIVTNIFVDGIDTGIADFEFEGTLVSAQIQHFAETAKNHGQFVSSIAKLANQLTKADLLTKAERNLLVDIAAKSSIGKK